MDQSLSPDVADVHGASPLVSVHLNSHGQCHGDGKALGLGGESGLGKLLRADIEHGRCSRQVKKYTGAGGGRGGGAGIGGGGGPRLL